MLQKSFFNSFSYYVRRTIFFRTKPINNEHKISFMNPSYVCINIKMGKCHDVNHSCKKRFGKMINETDEESV